MQTGRHLTALAASALAILASATVAQASPGPVGGPHPDGIQGAPWHGPWRGGPGGGPSGRAGAVFVQTDNPAGNEVVAYDRAPDGALTKAGTYSTRGLGGVLEGSVVDHLASQGSLAYDAGRGLLYAVNAGSDTVTVFAVSGDRLTRLQTVPSGGSFPVSITLHGDLLYVLDAEGGGTVQGFWVIGEHLVPIPGANVPLDLPTETPRFTHTPGQVVFSPDGSQLLVTTKAATNSLDVFRVGWWGGIAGPAVVDQLPGTVPFALVFQGPNQLLLTEAGPDDVASFGLRRDGTVAALQTVATDQAATCWIAAVGDHAYAANAGSASLTELGSAFGSLSVLGTAGTDPGPVDVAVSGDGRYLYAQTGGEGVVDEYAIERDGALQKIGSAAVPNAVGGEGKRRTTALADSSPVVDSARLDATGQWRLPPAHWAEESLDRLQAAEMGERIRMALEALPALQRRVVTLRDFEELTSVEVCEVLDLTAGNQRVLLHRGRSRLRQSLEERHHGGPS